MPCRGHIKKNIQTSFCYTVLIILLCKNRLISFRKKMKMKTKSRFIYIFLIKLLLGNTDLTKSFLITCKKKKIDDVFTSFTGKEGSLLQVSCFTSTLQNGTKNWQKYRHTVKSFGVYSMTHTHTHTQCLYVCFKCKYLA